MTPIKNPRAFMSAQHAKRQIADLILETPKSGRNTRRRICLDALLRAQNALAGENHTTTDIVEAACQFAIIVQATSESKQAREKSIHDYAVFAVTDLKASLILA